MIKEKKEVYPLVWNLVWPCLNNSAFARKVFWGSEQKKMRHNFEVLAKAKK